MMTPKDLPPSFQKSSLEGKVAVITGSTQGLGEATARLFEERGCRGLILTGRNEERGERLAKELTTESCRAYFVEADLENLGHVRDIFKVADSAFGTVDILVNAAATTDRGSLWDTTPEDYDRIMNVNTKAPFFLMQDAARIMEREKVAGSIINISSTASYGSMPMLVTYGMSKGALNVATKNIAYSLMWSKIRVNALAIGWMDTPGEDAIQQKLHCEGSQGGHWKSEGEKNQPFGRLLQPEEVARCIAFCASEESGMMTGCVIDFDQSVWGAGNAPVPPPMDQWAKAHGMTFSFDTKADTKTKKKAKVKKKANTPRATPQSKTRKKVAPPPPSPPSMEDTEGPQVTTEDSSPNISPLSSPEISPVRGIPGPPAPIPTLSGPPLPKFSEDRVREIIDQPTGSSRRSPRSSPVLGNRKKIGQLRKSTRSTAPNKEPILAPPLSSTSPTPSKRKTIAHPKSQLRKSTRSKSPTPNKAPIAGPTLYSSTSPTPNKKKTLQSPKSQRRKSIRSKSPISNKAPVAGPPLSSSTPPPPSKKKTPISPKSPIRKHPEEGSPKSSPSKHPEEVSPKSPIRKYPEDVSPKSPIRKYPEGEKKDPGSKEDDKADGTNSPKAPTSRRSLSPKRPTSKGHNPADKPYPDKDRPDPTEFRRMLQLDETQQNRLDEFLPGTDPYADSKKKKDLAKKKYGSNHSNSDPPAPPAKHSKSPSPKAPKKVSKFQPDVPKNEYEFHPQRMLQDAGMSIRPDDFLSLGYGRKREGSKKLIRSESARDYRAAKVDEWLGGTAGKTQRRSYRVKGVRNLMNEDGSDE